MSGHSKWSTIKRKKGLIDAERGKIFQKLAKEIYVAARIGDPDPDNNPNLRMVIEKARGQNMPKDNINKAIEKARGTSNAEEYEEIRYEGYGYGGVAFMVDCLSDNRNRTASFVRSTFTKYGGNLGTDGSVSYMFERKGLIIISNDYDEETVMMTAIEANALDFEVNEDNYVIITNPNDFIKVKETLEKSGITSFLTSEITFIPNIEVDLNEEEILEVFKLVEALEDLDDVQNVYYNLKN
ncbi:MAG: YebC/PmpR family DNA-binding transcriptional regulator [Tenericutes bacterium]|jgi:YebC/PmpR family DNA-binding regulatory protein|nr:YebC/PmpR family DNA-binding transcriptional regulator [Mycoplasmatota bacterium]